MGQVKTIYIEAKRSKNFQTYTVGMTVEVGFNQNVEELTKEYQTRCRKLAQEQIDIDSGAN